MKFAGPSGERSGHAVMSRRQQRRWVASSRKIVGSATAIVVIGLAIAIAIWRYEVAFARSTAALDAAGDSRRAVSLIGTFWHELEAMEANLSKPSPVQAREIAAQRDQFRLVASQIKPDTAAGRGLERQAISGFEKFYAGYLAARGAAGTAPTRELAAIERLNASAPPVLGTLAGLDRAQRRRATDAAASANSAAAQARAIGILAAILA